MSELFLKVVNMSISASWIVFAVLLLRVLLKKAPKWITVLLWGIVAIRLICPFSIESAMSLIPSTETIRSEIMMENTPAINTGTPSVDGTVAPETPEVGESLTPAPGASVNPLQIWIPVMSGVWFAGMAVMLAYTGISYFRVKKKIGTAVLFRENIFQSENVVSPFVLGIVKPKIYLPFYMREQDMQHVIAHENAHIGRKDHLWKPFGFLVLTLHWFNPLMWLGYVLLCRDIELACDEKVIKTLDAEQKADYSQALLTCSVNRRVIAACPLAFGEIGVKNRVKAVLNYKKPAFWIIIVALLASVIAAVCFLTNPVTSDNSGILLAVLNNEKTFINESGETIYLKNHKPFNSIDAIPQEYVMVDLDSDGTEELIVHFALNTSGYTVLHIYDDTVYGFDFEEREMVSLKTDGTFIQSSGAGINSFVTLRFEKEKKVLTEQSYCDEMAQTYRINGVSATVEAGKKYIDEFNNKPDVSWEPYKIALDAANTTFQNLKIIITLDFEKKAAVGLTVLDETTNKKIQDIELKENDVFANRLIYVDDINFDGEDDLIVPYQRSAAAAYFTAYIWDTATNQFVQAPTFETLSNVALDKDKKVILSSKSADKITIYTISVYDPTIKDFKIQRSLCYYPVGENLENMLYKEERFENGTSQPVAVFTKPIKDFDYYSMDPEIYAYYSNHTVWSLNSPKWKNYLILQKEASSREDGIIKIQIVNEEDLDDYPSNIQFYDTKVSTQSWKILVEATKDVENFRFIELDESEALKIGDTIVELATLKANSPILLHTYINDVTVNRGISYQDNNGVVRYFGFDCNLNGINDDLVSLVEITPASNDEQYNYLDIYDQFLAGKETALDESGLGKPLRDHLSTNYPNWENYNYAYLDMTGDGIPELCIDTLLEMYFFTIKNGKLHHWYTETNAYGQLLNNGAILRERHGGGPEHINYEYYELDKNAKKQFSITFSWWDGKTVDIGEVYPDYYEVNGQAVSKQEYEEQTKEYLTKGMDKIVWFNKNGKAS